MEDLGEWPTRYDPLSLSKSASPLGKHGMPHAQLAYDLPNAARSTAVTRTPSRGSPFLLALQSVGGRRSRASFHSGAIFFFFLSFSFLFLLPYLVLCSRCSHTSHDPFASLWQDPFVCISLLFTLWKSRIHSNWIIP